MKKKYSDYVKSLEKKGYKNTFYGDNERGNGIAYYETDKSILKITYEWLKIGNDHYKAGNVLDVLDVTECYK